MPAVNAGGGGFDWRVLLQAISTAAPMLAEARARRQSQDELHRGQLEQMALQSKVDKRIGDEVRDVAQSTPEAERARAAADYTTAVRKARTEGNASLPSALGGDRFQRDTSTLASAGTAYGQQRAGQLARIEAPFRQRVREGQAVTRAGLDVRREGSRASSMDYLARMRAANRGEVDPWISILAALGSKIASNYQRPDEQTQSDGLEEIDLASLPQRIALPQRIPPMRRMPNFGGGY